jgi:hypothetical protein
MVGHMTGRFQQYMMAGADRNPGVHRFTTEMIKNVPVRRDQAQMTDTQVAVAHQMYGSLPEQRGVSLTSTPKVGITYANTGGNFRTDEGFKLKIDLARVPDEVLFLNHYVEGGVSGMHAPDYTTRQSHKPVPYNYKYKESAAHARELFLEQIRPEWVVEIEHHAQGGFQNIGGQKATVGEGAAIDLLDAAKRAFGGEEYEKGYGVGLSNGLDDPILKTNRDYTKGKTTGKMVKEGFDKGVAVRRQKGNGNHTVAFKEIMEDPAIQDKLSPYHIGYAQGRTGQPMVGSVLELQTLLSSENEFKNSAKTGGTTSLAEDADKLMIRSSIPLQLGGFKTKTVTIPFEELRTARVEYEKDGEGDMEITIIKRSGDYSLSLREAEGTRFVQALQESINRHARRLTTRDVTGGRHALVFAAGTLKVESQQKSSLGVHKFRKQHIPIDTIAKVEFEWDDEDLQVNIHRRGQGTYEMSLKSAEALKVRALLLQNGVPKETVGAIPKKD